MDRPQQQAESWSTTPLVFVTIATCPACNSPDYSRVRTEAAGDGSYSQKRICTNCNKKYKAVFELPEAGKDAFDVS